MLHSRSFDVDMALRPARRALGLARCAHFVLRGFVVGSVVAAALLGLMTATGIEAFRLWAWISLALGPLLGLGLGIRRWPDLLHAARAVDRHFGLGDRLTTALEFRESNDPFALVQRSDAAHSVRGLPVHRAGRERPHWRERGMGILMLLVLVVLALQPQPNHSVAALAVTAPAEQRIHAAGASSIPGIEKSMGRIASGQNVVQARLVTMLHQLQRQLLRSSSVEQALRAVSLTQEQIRRLQASLHPVSGTAVARLNRSLGGNGSPSSSSNSTNPESAERTLSHLVNTLRSLTEAQRQRLAQKLGQAAHQAQNARLRQGLQRAANDLAHKRVASATVALKQAVKLMVGTQKAQRMQLQLGKVNNRLDKIKNQISGVRKQQPHRTAGPAHVGPGTKPSSQRSTRPAQKHGATHGKGGVVTSYRPPTQRTSSHNGPTLDRAHIYRDTMRDANMSRFGMAGIRHTNSLITGKELSGTRLVQNGPAGSSAGRTPLSYHQIVVRYARTARTALERGALPPDVQQYVRDYFDTISQ